MPPPLRRPRTRSPTVPPLVLARLGPGALPISHRHAEESLKNGSWKHTCSFLTTRDSIGFSRGGKVSDLLNKGTKMMLQQTRHPRCVVATCWHFLTHVPDQAWRVNWICARDHIHTQRTAHLFSYVGWRSTVTVMTPERSGPYRDILSRPLPPPAQLHLR